jgi:hypothetical protein
MQWQYAKPQARAQERKLGSKVGKAPDSRELETDSVRARDIGRIDVYELNMFGED